MASEIRVDKITSLSGVGTITPSPTGIDIAGITTVATLKATTGIVTTLTATTGIVTTLTANTVTSLGAVSGTTGTFSGAVSGTTGTFSGAVSGTTGTFSGAVSGTTATFTDDVEIADTIKHSGDTNTKIRFATNDQISFETNGSEKVVIDSSGTISTKAANAQFKSDSSNSGDWVRMYAGSGTGQWDIYGNGDHLRFTDNASAGAARFDCRLGAGSHPSHAQLTSYFSGTASYPPSGGLVQVDNDSHGLQVWNGSNSANYSALKLETRTTGASIWLMSNVYNSNFSGDLAFTTRTGGSANSERVRFRRDGGITFNGDTAAANALDDYEEGTWTPVPGVGTVTLGTGGAKYTRIGRVVFCQFDINYSGGSGNTGNSGFSLPFNSANIYGSGVVGWTNRGYPLFVHVQATAFAIMDNSSSLGGSSQHATYAELNGTRFIGDFRYFIA